MAELALQVVVSPLLGVVFDKLSSLLREFGSRCDVEEDLEKLTNTTLTIQGLLQDAKLKQNHHSTTSIWLTKLTDAAYEADDIIDECKALFSPHSGVNSGSCSTQVCNYFFTCFDFKNIILRHKIANKIKAVREKFDLIAEEGNKFQLNTGEIERGPVENITQYRETSSELLEDCVYGRDVEKERIVTSLLTNTSSKDNILVYSVIGMGGLGKTTLAQYVYNDMSIVNNFHTRIWVCVSQDFRANKLTKMIIESCSREKCDLESLEDLQNRLKELLSGKKFLLVLDDVWNEDQGNWEKLKFPLKCGAKGSSIIVTTRSSSVAQIMGALPVNQYKLGPLSDEECWSLFKRRAFGEGNLDNWKELERIGREIVKKCGGVPLAAKALGGSLRLVREVNEWNSIKSSAIWELRENDNDGGILRSLRLSYNCLPVGLRQCFAFCSIFPKDHKINIAELIQLWMANGLLQSEGMLDFEDVGRRTFNQLVWTSFFQNVEKDYYGETTCKMHDLMHDLACYVAENEYLAFNGGSEVADIPKSIRHLSISSDSMPANILKCLSNSHLFLRTFLQTTSFAYVGRSNIAFDCHRCLRVLDLSCNKIKYIPASIGRMKHLRYLNLSYTYIVCLPSSLCNLTNLQTLKLRSCFRLKTLPEKMNSLVNLLHLDLTGCNRLTQMPLGIGEWVNLRSLGAFFVGTENGQSIKELGKLDKLGGDLDIHNLELVRDVAEASIANLAAKTNLVDIEFHWTGPPRVKENSEEDVLEALQPHQGLSGGLWIDGYGGSRFPSWIQNFEKLSVFALWNCSRFEDLPPLGHLPLLKRVAIGGMDSLKRINKEFYGISSSQGFFFPSLVELKFTRMPNWEEWEALDDKHVFPCLTDLSVCECPNLALIPSTNLCSLQDLSVQGCKRFTVASLPSLRFLQLADVSSMPVGSLLNLDALESLELSFCKFSSIPQNIEDFSPLKSLKIYDCHALTSVSQFLQHLSSLESLYIDNCDQLEFSIGDFHHLLALKYLNLLKLPQLTSLPDLQHLPTLQSLVIWGCYNLSVLPPWMKNLTSLHTLEIKYCHHDLHVRCEKDKGEYWPYISLIPQLNIFYFN